MPHTSRLARRVVLPAIPVALGVSSAEAVIIYTNPGPITITTDNSTIYFDLNRSGGSTSGFAGTANFTGADFFLNLREYNGGYDKLVRRVAGGEIAWNGDHAFNFALSDPIGGNADFSSNDVYIQMFDNSFAAWPTDGTPGYLGFRLDAGSSVYGWAKISVTENSLTLHEFAYESEFDTEINAGAIPIPEPSTWAIAAGLLAGSAVLHRRRQQKKPGR